MTGKVVIVNHAVNHRATAFHLFHEKRAGWSRSAGNLAPDKGTTENTAFHDLFEGPPIRIVPAHETQLQTDTGLLERLTNLVAVVAVHGHGLLQKGRLSRPGRCDGHLGMQIGGSADHDGFHGRIGQ